jgi:hypothetical protein
MDGNGREGVFKLAWKNSLRCMECEAHPLPRVRTESRLDLNNSIIQELDSNEAVQVLIARCFVSQFTQKFSKPRTCKCHQFVEVRCWRERATVMACKRSKLI